MLEKILTFQNPGARMLDVKQLDVQQYDIKQTEGRIWKKDGIWEEKSGYWII